MANEDEELEDLTVWVDVPPVYVEQDDTWTNVANFDSEDEALAFAKDKYGAELGWVSLVSPAHEVFILDRGKGKAVQEILNRYVNEELRPQVETWSAFYVGLEGAANVQKDIDYITGLAKLFD